MMAYYSDMPGIPLLYAPTHQLHAPPTEFDQGRLISCSDNAERIERIRQRLVGAGLAELVESKKPVTLDDLTPIHNPNLLNYLAQRSETLQPGVKYRYPELFALRPSMARLHKHPSNPDGFYALDIYTPIGHHTWQAALASAGLAIAGAQLLLDGRATCAYALCRPPGHHAGKSTIAGYCYLNNAALAAYHLLPIGKVSILDIDYHHGNGTQEIFWEEQRVFVASLHADPAFEYPYYAGYADEAGGSHAPGTNINVPLPAGTGGKEYLAALEYLLEQAVRIRPSAVVVSIGYDTVRGDPTGTFQLEAGDFAEIGLRLAQLRLPLLLIQEGGYRLDLVPELAENLVKSLLSP